MYLRGPDSQPFHLLPVKDCSPDFSISQGACKNGNSFLHAPVYVTSFSISDCSVRNSSLYSEVLSLLGLTLLGNRLLFLIDDEQLMLGNQLVLLQESHIVTESDLDELNI